MVFFIMQGHLRQKWHCMMLTVSSMAPLHSLHQENLNEVQHDLLGDVMSLALALVSHNADSVINGNIAFPQAMQSKLGAT